jgi:hypothetical protein
VARREISDAAKECAKKRAAPGTFAREVAGLGGLAESMRYWANAGSLFAEIEDKRGNRLGIGDIGERD